MHPLRITIFAVALFAFADDTTADFRNTDILVLGDSQISIGSGRPLKALFSDLAKRCAPYVSRPDHIAALDRRSFGILGVRASSLQSWTTRSGPAWNLLCRKDRRFGVNGTAWGTMRSNRGRRSIQAGHDPKLRFCRRANTPIRNLLAPNYYRPKVVVFYTGGTGSGRLAAKKSAKRAESVRDDGESVALMEPMRIGEGARSRAELSERAFHLTQQAAGFRARLPEGLVAPLADLVRSMNCYYSNLIEGHNTYPIDIERAVHGDFSDDPLKRDLQLEAKAHIAVQRCLDDGNLDGREASVAGRRDIHQRFVALLPDDLRWVENPDTESRQPVVPGAWRTGDVQVGRHVAVSPGAIPRFMERFTSVYDGLGKFEQVLGAGPAHHRLLWIHPFADGNGRVTRLMSHAMMRCALNTGGLWSVSRGLARQEATYKAHLAACDLAKRNDLDGRGHLSEEALIDFAAFFIDVCTDQVAFMEGLMRPKELRDRILAWAHDEVAAKTLPAAAPRVLDAVLFRGALPRGEVAGVIGQSERSARNVMNALAREGIVYSAGPRADWEIGFPAKLASRIMPGLF